MESAHQTYRPRGVPRWILWSAVPVMLAMGFVTGMAIATYRTDGVPGADAEPTISAPKVGAAAPAPQTTSTQTDTSFLIPTTTGSASPIPGLTGEHPLETNGRPTAPITAPPKFTGPATNRDEARRALASDFGVYSHEGAVFRVEYQTMAHVNRGLSLIGIIDISDYPHWEKALKDSPVALTAWLQKAADRVLDASKRDGFHIAWAVIGTPNQRPAGFADNEITPMDNGTYLVIRRLASTMDHTKTVISLRPLTSLQESAANKAITSNDPWATYGPVIFFDSTDVYRPSRLTGAKPL